MDDVDRGGGGYEVEICRSGRVGEHYAAGCRGRGRVMAVDVELEEVEDVVEVEVKLEEVAEVEVEVQAGNGGTRGVIGLIKCDRIWKNNPYGIWRAICAMCVFSSSCRNSSKSRCCHIHVEQRFF